MSSSASTASNLSGQSAEIRQICKDTEDVELPASKVNISRCFGMGQTNGP